MVCHSHCFTWCHVETTTRSRRYVTFAHAVAFMVGTLRCPVLASREQHCCYCPEILTCSVFTRCDEGCVPCLKCTLDQYLPVGIIHTLYSPTACHCPAFYMRGSDPHSLVGEVTSTSKETTSQTPMAVECGILNTTICGIFAISVTLALLYHCVLRLQQC